MNKIIYTKEATYNSNIILVDGFSGTGKNLILDLLKAFVNVEISHGELLFDFLPILYELDPKNAELGKSLIKNRFDEITYNICISRNINFRLKDVSSVFKHPKWFDYLIRLFKIQPKDKIVENYASKLHIPIFTHATSFNNDFYAKTFGNRIKILITVRDPLFSVNNYSNYLEKIVNTPREQQLKFSLNGEEYPWYAKGWEEEFINANFAEKSIKMLSNGYNNLFENFVNNKIIDQNKIKIIFFENLVSNTDNNFKNLANFLSIDYKKDYFIKLKKRNNIPRSKINLNDQSNNRYEKKIQNSESMINRLIHDIQDKVSPRYFNQLMSLRKKYYKFKSEFENE